MRYRKTAAMACVTLLIALPAYAQDAVSSLADGSAWTTEGPRGGNIQITFLPDGTGQAGSGIFARSLAWEGEGDLLCISGLPGAASGCMTLSKTTGGFTGRREDGSTLRFWR